MRPGDIRWPVVIGGVWNKVDTPPEGTPLVERVVRWRKPIAAASLVVTEARDPALPTHCPIGTIPSMAQCSCLERRSRVGLQFPDAG